MTATTPFDEAAAVYEREACANTFEHDLVTHLRHGYVYSTPIYFIMGRPVNSKAPRELLLDPECVFQRDEHDAWLVWLYAGDLPSALAAMPYPLPKVMFQRGSQNELRELPIDRVQLFLAKPTQ